MTDVLRIAHPQNCPPYGNSRVGICEGNLMINLINHGQNKFEKECFESMSRGCNSCKAFPMFSQDIPRQSQLWHSRTTSTGVQVCNYVHLFGLNNYIFITRFF